MGLNYRARIIQYSRNRWYVLQRLLINDLLLLRFSFFGTPYDMGNTNVAFAHGTRRTSETNTYYPTTPLDKLQTVIIG